jgi:ATPase family associated with various cellular activities (AAA)
MMNMYDYIEQLMKYRLSQLVPDENQSYELPLLPEPFTPELIQQLFGFPLGTEEAVILYMALIPHIQPQFYDKVIRDMFPQGGDFPELGGVRGSNHRGMLPTGETILFLMAGNAIGERLRVQQYFLSGGSFNQFGLLWLETVKDGEPGMSGRIILASDFVEKFLMGKESPPRFSTDFPAKRINTIMEWQDLVLHPQTMEQVNDIRVWLEHHAELQQDTNLARKIKPGYRVLFYGPPGTGKTLTASLLGKEFNKEVYKIDLSQVVSKYIGETEKNLEKIFNKAEHKDWVLFFDEADALFGKRTNVQSSHDRYANQEVAYLLQRVEDFQGLLILASNFKSNLDDAFVRRFHSIVHFPMPGVEERRDLWLRSLPVSLSLSTEVDIQELAERYELTGASILNIVHYAALRSLSRKDGLINGYDLLTGIRREFRKEDKSV